MVRPLIAPMAEARRGEERRRSTRRRAWRIRANAAAVDNIGVFFGEDIFIAIGSILLIKGFCNRTASRWSRCDLAFWAIPTAILAFLIHGARLMLLDRRLSAVVARGSSGA